MKLIGRVLSVFAGLIILLFIGSGITLSLINKGASIVLIFIVGFNYFLSIILYFYIIIHENRPRSSYISSKELKRIKKLKKFRAILFIQQVFPMLIIGGYEVLKLDMPIIFIIFLVLIFVFTIPILIKRYNNEISINEAKGLVTILVLILSVILFVTKIISDVFDWGLLE